ncbi:ribulose bisphosphate carboxylase small subunit [Synechococcus sp. Nb3U1]|uniref:ribulose bisphosphate carboxylase small subunit n=1 Tax=Synechococcus sp. Nb3U1 TaxID=1914529 RepID=UPI001F247DB4|nr:ribulose bisphosphate carboxylase small subunit [Synechococcus sp. Nb3U1]MCF2970815.1 ribulose bisphosphate carboxylase small subunit [Synechococcus sp. Nb3U1]
MSYYIAPAFLKTVALHLVKNHLDLRHVRVPLILGIHGRKGEGKTFQCDLIFERMKVHAIHISGGELESPDAGDPARMIRLRYREAGEHIRKFGQLATLMINDLDAGAGRLNAMTQYTVNTQLVSATLMNIADNPTNVQLPGSYDAKPLPRVPIIVTGNDFSTLYAPLIRDGRMSKFYWDPSREDRINIVQGIFQSDGLSSGQIERLVDTFPEQAIDFFGALRSQIYDEQVWHFIQQVGLEGISFRLLKSKEGAPSFPPPQFSLEQLIQFGQQLKTQQQQVENRRLSEEYLGLKRPSAQEHSLPPSSLKTQPSPFNPSSVKQNLELPPEVESQIRQILAQGYEIQVEHVDKRRYRVNSWQSCGAAHLKEWPQTREVVEQCLSHFPGEYIRLVGVDPAKKQRMVETIIQRP